MVDMEPRSNIENLLQTGYFTTARARSARPSIPSSESYIPRRASPRAQYDVPRYIPRPPPPPTVEDEAESLLKEHGSSPTPSLVDDTPSRGDVDQVHILEEVHEFNPERRFVLVPGSEPPEKASPQERSVPAPGKGKEKPAHPQEDATVLPEKVLPQKDTNGAYGANTTRKLSSLAPESAADVPHGGLERRKSRQDLPRIETEFSSERAKSRDRRPMKSPAQTSQPTPDYFSPQVRSRVSPAAEDLLSPQVIKHTTGGRDKAYYDYTRSQKRPASPHRTRSSLIVDRRTDDGNARPSQSSSPGTHRRSSSYADVPRPVKPLPDDKPSDSPRYRDEYEKKRERRSSTCRRESPPRRVRDGRDGSSGSDGSLMAPPPNTRRRRSTVIHDDRPFLKTPDKERPPPPSGRSRSRAPVSPLASPKILDTSPKSGINSTPRSSVPGSTWDGRDASGAQYPGDRTSRNETYGGRGIDTRPPRSRSQAPPSLSSSVPNLMPATMLMSAAAAAPPAVSGLADRKRSPGATTPEPRASTPQPGARPDSSWPPPAFDPSQNKLAIDKPVGSFRRYSEDAQKGGLPHIPECPRTKGIVGKTDWLALPRCDNLTICPDCYASVFSESAFRNEFVPMPLRSLDKPISCDFGRSPWYRIAWLLTLKNEQPDLRLFYRIAKIAGSSSQSCPGDRKTMRVWYSIKDPYRQCTLPDFTVCYECAKTVEVLLPNLTGLFVPSQSAVVPTWSDCSMHFHPDRKRFVLYFDALETTSDNALATTSAPNIAGLAKTVERLSAVAECREDRPAYDQSWHVMQYLPELTVCGECFDDVVRPRMQEGGVIARNFYMKPQRLPAATCQLYSERMRDVFRRACRRNDPKYLEGKVLERRRAEADIHAKMAMLRQHGMQDPWTDKEINKLKEEWKRWE